MFEFKIIFNNAVVHDDDFSGAVTMRVGVFFSRASMRRPSGVADPILTVDWVRRDDLFETIEFSGAAPNLNVAVFNESNPGRIVAAIFQSFETVDQNLNNRLGPEIANNAAHAGNYVREWSSGARERRNG